MTITGEDFEDFDEKSEEEKRETLRKLHEKLEESGDSGLLQEMGLDYEVTVTVYDEDGNKKQEEKEEFNTKEVKN